MFAYPSRSYVNRPLPKSKVYSFAKPTRAVRDRFVQHVSEIVWRCKLSPETVNLAARGPVQEIQAFEIALKSADIAPKHIEEMLRTMDKAIPSHLFFELTFGERVRFAATHKRPNEADSSKSVIDLYFETDWIPAAEPRSPLPVALDLAGLYEQMLHLHMLRCPMALSPRDGESLGAMVDRANQIRSKQRECAQLETRLQREVQFNRKVEINAELRARRAELAQLS